MKRTLTISALLLFALAATASAQSMHGSWTANASDSTPGRLQMNVSRGGSQHFGHSMNLSDFTGLSGAQVNSSAAAPVQFQLVRDAGTLSFEGTFRNGDGAGQWTFAPSRGYSATLRSLGVDFDRDEEDDQMLTLAMLDVSSDYIRSMQAIGYREDLGKYISMRIFKVTPELVAELRSLGYDHLSADELVSMRVHKVTPDYIRQMRAAGWNLSAEELMSSRIHQATPEFAEEMKKLGYNLKFDDLIAFRIHRVTADFIRELHELGYDRVSADNLVAMRIHRVTPEYIKELKAAGYSNIPVSKLINMKIHRIDAKFINDMNQ